MAEIIKLLTHEDYIDRALRVTPQSAVFELIWNACDADATEIKVSFTRNEMDKVVGCFVEDNGCGIDY